MAPHSLDTILPSPQWPASLAQFVTWCLMWDPKARPTSAQALAHEYFSDAVDPLKPKPTSSSPRTLRSRNSELSRPSRENLQQLVSQTQQQPQVLNSKPSWFRKSFQ